VELAQQITGLLVVFGLLGILIWTFGRKGGQFGLRLRRQVGSGKSLQVIDRLVLTPQHVLHLVGLGERTLLIATHPHGVLFEA